MGSGGCGRIGPICLYSSISLPEKIFRQNSVLIIFSSSGFYYGNESAGVCVDSCARENAVNEVFSR